MNLLSALLSVALLILPTMAPAAPRRALNVSLYPYIPEAAAAALSLKQGFEHLHPDVIVNISLNMKAYSTAPKDGGFLYEDADVHEIDVVFLRDFLARHKVQPPGPALADAAAGLTPLARQAATYDGTLMAMPHWMCADFLIYRADKAALGTSHTLEAVEGALGPDHGLLLSMKGFGQLGELYLTSLLASTGDSPELALANLSSTPDPAILARLRRILALEPAGLGRKAAYGNVESFYARQFARRTGAAFVGYSELAHDVLDETATGCRAEDRCVTADQLRVTGFPFADNRIRPTVWVDMFVIDSRVHGDTVKDARDFIGYAVSLPAYRALLIPPPDGAPRYLLPASQAAFTDPSILRTAPLYPKFRAIIDKGVVVSVPHLSATLHDIAARIDAALPQDH